ncbi:hypothetical protein K7432_005598 [Basidiobolus ranarum]|uniref:ABC transporter domain-containing protein n=1 Tax=Basidiobolus ranarum TaxID=34480 RepID=A0ABR2W356_9FUNG
MNTEKSSNARYKSTCERSKWRQFKALIKKQVLHGIRDKVSLYNGLLSPIYMIAILIIIKAVSIPAVIDVKPFMPLTEGTCSVSQPNCVHMGYIANGPIEETLTNLRKLFAYSEPKEVSIRRFADYNELANHFSQDPSSLVVGVTFNTNDRAQSAAYEIHANHTLSKDRDYVTTRSLTIQAYIERAIANVRRQASGQTLLSSPLPPKEATFGKKIDSGSGRNFLSFTQLGDNTFVKYILPFMSVIFLNFAFQPLIIYYMTVLNIDKKIKIKGSMLMMGLSHTIYLATIWVYLLAFSLVPIIMVVILIYATQIIKSIAVGYILGSMIFYGIGMIALCTMLSIYFSSTKTAPFAGLIVTLASIALSIVYESRWIATLSPTESSWLFLVSPVAFGRVISLLSNFDSIEEMNNQPHMLSLNFTFLMIFVDCVLYLLIAWYVDHLKPGEEGIALPWNFLFCRSYWKSTKLTNMNCNIAPVENSELLAASKISDTDKHMFETQDVSFIDPKDRGAILITDLKKSFQVKNKGLCKGSRKINAVNSLDLDLNRGQVLAFLGHNGAGKTTTISMLSGLTLPDDGTISIFDQTLPTRRNRSSNIHVMAQVQQMLGVCPQFDILIDTFSAVEHMELFAAIRGLRILGKIEDNGTVTPGKQEDLQREYIIEMMSDVSLPDKCFEKSGSYSGGMKRKLSLAIALLGNPSIILLDEPTTGMDVYSRNQIWQLIQDSKEGRVVILTTHSMEEADALGDRIAIMSKGKLQTLGSSLFLKNRFGVGYHLSLTKKDTSNGERTETLNTVQRENMFDEQGLTAFIQTHLATAQLIDNTPHNITYLLPNKSEDQEKYPDFFEEMETICKQERYGVIGFGLSTTTLEEVFISLQEKEKE